MALLLLVVMVKTDTMFIKAEEITCMFHLVQYACKLVFAHEVLLLSLVIGEPSAVTIRALQNQNQKNPFRNGNMFTSYFFQMICLE